MQQGTGVVTQALNFIRRFCDSNSKCVSWTNVWLQQGV
jgi:hypothetical protein